MKNKIIKFSLFLMIIGVSSCEKDENNINSADNGQSSVIEVTTHDGAPFNTNLNKVSEPSSRYVAGPGGGVMMQAFYWDCPAGGTWWNTIGTKVTAWGNAGISSIWLPPASKAQNGAFSMGYDPTDYYDFGNFNQNGSLETRFGSKTELVSLITKAHTENIQVYADIVINHNSGGQSEANPFTGTST